MKELTFNTRAEAVTEAKRQLNTMPKGWKACTTTNPRNKTHRPSLRLNTGDMYILHIDGGWYGIIPSLSLPVSFHRTPLAALKATKKKLKTKHTQLTKLLNQL